LRDALDAVCIEAGIQYTIDRNGILHFEETKKSIGIGTLITERPSHTTEHTDHNNGGSAVQGW
jgi:hypothetical protein